MIHRQSIAVDLAFYDNAEYYDHLHRAQSEAGYRPVHQSITSGTAIRESSSAYSPEMTNTSMGHFRGGRGKPRISRTFNRLPRAVGSASVPAGDRAALVGSAKPVIINLYSSASGPGVSRAGWALASSAIPRASNFSAIKLRSRYHGNPSPI